MSRAPDGAEINPKAQATEILYLLKLWGYSLENVETFSHALRDKVRRMSVNPDEWENLRNPADH